MLDEESTSAVETLIEDGLVKLLFVLPEDATILAGRLSSWKELSYDPSNDKDSSVAVKEFA